MDLPDYLEFLTTCCLDLEFDPADISLVVDWEPSIPDEENGWALFQLQDGRWATLNEYQDYTGHG